jgi:hypothetical protein
VEDEYPRWEAGAVTDVIVVGEGQTEETFVRDVLAPALAAESVFLGPRLVPTSPGRRGGALSYPRVLRYLRNTLRQRGDTYVTTFFDLYRLDDAFPGFSESATLQDPLARAALIETRLSEVVIREAGCRENRFFAHILQQQDGKNRLLRAVKELSQAFALAVPHDEAVRIRDDVAFFQAVRTVLVKSAPGERRPSEEIDLAIRQIVSRAIASDQVIDIFAAAGLKKPDISILSDEFLAEVHRMPQRNLAVELLRKLLTGAIKTRSRKNLVQSRSFAEMLEQAIKRYQNRAIETAQVIEELIALAKDLREADRRGEKLRLSEEELAFYDALEVNDSAVKVLGEPILKNIARELVDTVRKNATIDWTVKESVRAKLRVLVKRILRKYGYPPDKQEKAAQTVLEQAELLCGEWAIV